VIPVTSWHLAYHQIILDDMKISSDLGLVSAEWLSRHVATCVAGGAEVVPGPTGHHMLVLDRQHNGRPARWYTYHVPTNPKDTHNVEA
jgi:hypothetical protein